MNELQTLMNDISEWSDATFGDGQRKEFKSGKTMPAWYTDAWKLPKDERAKLRSKTYPGIAKAIAEQWTTVILGCA